MIDILAWDWNLRIAVGPAFARPKARFHGPDYGRDFTIHGRVRGPRELRGKGIKVTLSPFGPKVRFGRRGLQQVGDLIVPPETPANLLKWGQRTRSYYREPMPTARNVGGFPTSEKLNENN